MKPKLNVHLKVLFITGFIFALSAKIIENFFNSEYLLFSAMVLCFVFVQLYYSIFFGLKAKPKDVVSRLIFSIVCSFIYIYIGL